MNPCTQMYLVSSLEKVFFNQTPTQSVYRLAGLRNESISFQTAIRYDGARRKTTFLVIESPIAEYIRCREVVPVPSGLPAYPKHDSNYLRTEPGLYPDLLKEINDKTVILSPCQWMALWFDICPNDKLCPGIYPITVKLNDKTGAEMASVNAEITVLDAVLPEQKLIYTQWFHADCLADYYNISIFSDEHWRIMEKFIQTAVRLGINMILTPLVTPPLDTAVGAERPTVQLLDISINNGEYSFCFERLKKWIDICEACGIKYFEFNHLFTQWGAEFCPKIIAIEDGKEKRIFGWDTKSNSDEYRHFLSAMLPALTEKLREWGMESRCWFHISDEPKEEHIENYLTAKQMVQPYLEGFPVIDALSRVEFYDRGIVKNPVPATNHIEPFLEMDINGLWTYYCSAQSTDVSNRFFSMPSSRNRIIGYQLYKYGITGFLHWGYNFYYSQLSIRKINPYCNTDADYAFPSGDAFSVYPGVDGKPEESITAMVFLHALQDIRALELLESLTDKEFVINLIEEGLTVPLTFSVYPQSQDYILDVRERINNEIIKRQTKSCVKGDYN